LQPNRLMLESFNVLEPYWALRTGSVPFWMKFNMEPSLEAATQYLKNTEPYDYIHLMLFSHGVEAVGLPTIEQWSSVFDYARKHGSFLGVDTESFPRDFGVFVKYQTDLMNIKARYPMPGMLSLGQFESFLDQFGDHYPVEFVDHPVSEASELAGIT
jgi:hypothetical protein